MKQVIFLGESKSPLIASLGRSRVTVMRWLWNRRERKKLGLQGWVTAPRSFGETQKQKTLIKLCCSPHCQVSRSLVARMEDSRTLLHTQMTRVHTHTHAHTHFRDGESVSTLLPYFSHQEGSGGRPKQGRGPSPPALQFVPKPKG